MECNMHSIIEECIRTGREVPKGLICVCNYKEKFQVFSMEEVMKDLHKNKWIKKLMKASPKVYRNGLANFK